MIARIIEIVDEAKDIKSFRLQPEQEMKYVPGQWFYVKLDENLKHHFTISSSPTENFLQFTTKYREESDYKKALWQKRAGDSLEINGPFGSFVLDEKDTSPRLFIAGGIGITPFRSMIKYATDR
ncbi:MAG: Oxidoreductase, 2Fe-2S and FAD/NAD(P) binding domain protein [Candidatus Amesbacteria bacterium GW2011_GWA1_46_35]|nr:MAG: Oxidoreductase, 2Fe-2S and FAD/NAD(P) binding domain protein [Candidatus Amesbacteria bacterium GW2011_GWA1_46_35]KKU69625.1 MAG: Oxidoreductase, 2Fe-2S and FAD/NAD(P) binding domain protein [Microgenomates group bacterium GW2011_GWC1_47_20]